MTRAELLQRLEPYQGRDETIVASQDTGDIMQGMARWHKEYGRQYDAVSSFFLGKTPRETAANVFDFLKKNVTYQIDTDERQTLKTPAAILATGHGDCKHYALFAGGIFDSLTKTGQQRIPWAFRFASYRWYDETPQHVFVVIYPGTSREIWVDPVLGRFDQKKPYQHASDHKMALVGISGIHKSARISGIRDVLKKGKQVVLKVYAAPSRAAFLSLVSLNVFGLGSKILTVWTNNPASLRNWWEGLGGAIDALVKAATKGGTKRRILGPGASLGEVTVASVIVAAAPVLIAVIDLFKRNNIPTEDIEAAARGGLDVRARDAAMEIVDEDEAERVKAELIERRVTESGSQAPARGGIPTVALVAGGALVLLLVMRKR